MLTDVILQKHMFPIEIIEMILMKASLSSIKINWISTSKPEEMAFERLAEVCEQWWTVLSHREWFKRQLARRIKRKII